MNTFACRCIAETTDGLCDGVGPLLVPRSDGFVGRYSYDLQTTQALTYLGGSDHESIRAVNLRVNGKVSE